MMSLTNATSIRLSIQKQQFYEAEAAARKIPLRTYLRQRLEEGDNVIEEISSLRRSIEHSTEMLKESKGEGNDMGIMLEMLLLLRQIAQPERKRLVQEELKRLSYKIWNGE